MLAGLCAGVLAAGFAAVVGEPHVNAAIAFEEAHADPAAPAEAEAVTRDTQSTVGLLIATGVYGAAFGGLFAFAFAVVYGRVGRRAAMPTAVLLAAAAFVAMVLVPFLKYPSNPPATGDPDTIQSRTVLFLAMMAIAVAAIVAGVRIARRWGAAAGVGTFLVLVVAAAIVMPGVSEVPRDFPATTLWEFRLASLGTQLVLWSSLGVLFGVTAQRALARNT
jgi:hypothetical protein